MARTQLLLRKGYPAEASNFVALDSSAEHLSVTLLCCDIMQDLE